MNLRHTLCAGLFLVLLAVATAFAQGTFQNLDFEEANPIPIVGSPYYPHEVAASNAFPGWTVSAGYIFHDTFSLSGGSITIFDGTQFSSAPSLQGIYSAYLASFNYPEYGYSISLGQTGQIPLWAQSITFWGDIGGMQITFNGQPLSFSTFGRGTNYTVYGADVSAFAGQTGELLFTVPARVASSTLDNIQFSSQPTPEPAVLSLLALGSLLFGWQWRRRKG